MSNQEPGLWTMDFGLLECLPQAGGLFSLRHIDLEWPVRVEGPRLEIQGQVCSNWQFVEQGMEQALENGGREVTLLYASADMYGLGLVVSLRGFADSPVIRLRYSFSAARPLWLVHREGQGGIQYLRLSQPGMLEAVLNTGALSDYQLSHFDPVAHSYLPNREDFATEDVLNGQTFTGPVALFHTSAKTLLAAYEHGADHPNGFFRFRVEKDDLGSALALEAVKGNFFSGQLVDGWESVWFELGLHPQGLEGFLPAYRRFFLDEVCDNCASRTPDIYYNTWNYQERQKYFHGRPYLESMHAQRMLDEIDVAHRLGVDVFVVDTGWYQKTGDWLPNLERFPEGLQEVRRRLEGYGMRMGLWFNPTVAALTSRVYQEHPEWEMAWDGKPRWRGPVWETEESTSMCLASDYAEYFIDTMVRLHEELGVSYFKWDAVQQYGCNSPLHHHGTEDNSASERADCYAYQMGLAMIHIVEEVTRRVPGAIVDFDITEGGRFVGLGFLSVSKFYLVNNGPYFSDFDIPRSVQIDPDTINVFFYPGPARARVCRTGARYDALVPSILFMTHYLTDGPRLSQANSLASLVLGGNGLWGDLPALSEEDVSYWHEQIELYKRVAADATRAYPRVRGFAGSSPEIHEKILPETCAGLVAFFTVTPAEVRYITQPLNIDALGQVVGADAWEVVEGGRLRLTVRLERDGARVVYLLPG